MRIREYAAVDFQAVYELDRSCYPPGIAYSRYALRAFLAEPGTQGFVVEAEGRLIGFALVACHRGGAGHIITLDVAPDHRRRQVGTALLAHAERWLAAQGVQQVWLETAVDNEAGVAFWRKSGYRQRRVVPRYYLDRIDAYVMEKELERLTVR
ncbi:MAG: GNAT family N-acetyltransferase [Acidobacteria bacterium]|nr:GNAT family N-acetyltransferase [Acidobacteriota bacterium]